MQKRAIFSVSYIGVISSLLIIMLFTWSCSDNDTVMPGPDEEEEQEDNGGEFTWGKACDDMPTIDYEDQDYHTVKVGDQCWLRENLNVGTMIESTEEMTDDSIIEKYCHDNDPANCEIYGGLYQWDEAMGYTKEEGAQGICPPGWHIPTKEDWQELEEFLGDHAGGKLKAPYDWYEPNTGATNSTGFSALPGGHRGGACTLFYNLGREGRWWTSSEQSTNGAWRQTMYHDSDTLNLNPNFKYYGISVRCVRSG